MRNKGTVAIWILLLINVTKNQNLEIKYLLIDIDTNLLANQSQKCNLPSSFCFIPNTSEALNQFNFSSVADTNDLTVLRSPNAVEIEIGEHKLEELPKLNTICLQGVLILPKSLHNLASLTTIELTKCRIQKLDENLTSAGNNINALHIKHSKIPHISRNFLAHLENLKDLLLRQNEIETIEAGAFDNFTKLESLVLTGNNFGTFPAIFHNLQQLRILVLSKNKLKDLGHQLQHLSTLEILHLSDNELVHIDDGLFKNMKLLGLLDLSSNQIVRRNGVTAYLPQLLTLNLAFNRIEEFNESVIFENYPALQMLNIFKNDMPKEYLSQFAAYLREKYSGNVFVQF